MLVCRDLCSPSSGAFIATTASLVALWVVTVTVFGVVTAVLSWQSFKLKQKDMLIAKPYRWYKDDNYNESNVVMNEWMTYRQSYSECFNMQLPSAGSPFLFQSPNKRVPPTPHMFEWMCICTYISQRKKYNIALNSLACKSAKEVIK